MLALEQAKRLASRGMNVVLTCFNRNLASWLETVVQDFGPGKVVTGHIHGLLRDRINRSSFASDLRAAEAARGADLYDKIYFELGALAIEELGERFHAAIIDEVQDMPPARLADVVFAWTSEQDGARILLAGDFTRQALYGHGTYSAADVKEAFGKAPIFNLGLNCRNTRRIAIQTDFMSGFPGTRVSPRQVDGDPVEVVFFSGPEEGLKALEKIVHRLKQEGFHPRDVILLGSRRMENSLLTGRRAIDGWALSESMGAHEECLVYSTIHAFKGLERPVIILIDVASGQPDEADSLLYVGMSRARLRLFILCPEESRPSIEERLARGAAALAGAA